MEQIASMRFSIVKDLPGYLRVRFGAHAFAAEEGYGIAEELERILGVTSVKTAVANGSVLCATTRITKRPGKRFSIA